MTDFPPLNAVIFAAIGVLVFLVAFAVAGKLAPFDIWKEIKDRNTAAAIFAGAVALGLCWIIAAAMH